MFACVSFAGLALADDDGDSSTETTNGRRSDVIKQRIEARKDKVEELKEKRVENREERKEKRCENVEKRVQTRINRYENNHSRHVKILENMEARLAKVITLFDEKGLDVSKLEADTATLSDMIDDVVATHETFVGELGKSENYACGESEGEFKKQLSKARRVLPEVKEGIEQIRTFYKDTIRPEILDLRSQLEEEDEKEDEDEDMNEDE